jgi:hypothetical protein
MHQAFWRFALPQLLLVEGTWTGTTLVYTKMAITYFSNMIRNCVACIPDSADI